MISNDKAREILDGAPEGAVVVLTTNNQWNGCKRLIGSCEFGFDSGSNAGNYVDAKRNSFSIGARSWRVKHYLSDLRAQLASAESIDNSEEWNGEGLPPVGYRCVVTPHNSMWGFGSVDDRTGVVLMYKAESFVFAIDTPDVCVHNADVVVSRTDKADFSKIPNKEELAAKARKTFSTDISNIEAELALQLFNDTSRDTLGERLYDLGYRIDGDLIATAKG